jgi:hypothetical protein
VTQFIPVTHIGSVQFSPLQDDSGCDISYLIMQNESEQSLYLAYSVKRDFLSVPLTYNIVKFSCASCLEIHQMPIEEYLDGFEEDVSIPQPGFYQFEAHDDGREDLDEDETDILIIVDREKVMELTYEKVERLTDIYHSADAKAALMSALSAL